MQRSTARARLLYKLLPVYKETAMSLSDEMSKLAQLRASGALTEEEFTRAKERLLNAEHSPGPDPLGIAVNSFRRSRNDRWIGGVCGGIARSTAVESWVWRLLFAVLFLCAGAGLLVYLLLWIFVPSE
jgi:phage shock protein PspC (stress-responsive transcriptional regulator)